MRHEFFPMVLCKRYPVGGLAIGWRAVFVAPPVGLVAAVFRRNRSRLRTQRSSLRDSRNWRAIYALGMLLAALCTCSPVCRWRPGHCDVATGVGRVAHRFWRARLGGGCTSGHGICSMASLSVGSHVDGGGIFEYGDCDRASDECFGVGVMMKVLWTLAKVACCLVWQAYSSMIRPETVRSVLTFQV